MPLGKLGSSIPMKGSNDLFDMLALISDPKAYKEKLAELMKHEKESSAAYSKFTKYYASHKKELEEKEAELEKKEDALALQRQGIVSATLKYEEKMKVLAMTEVDIQGKVSKLADSVKANASKAADVKKVAHHHDIAEKFLIEREQKVSAREKEVGEKEDALRKYLGK